MAEGHSQEGQEVRLADSPPVAVEPLRGCSAQPLGLENDSCPAVEAPLLQDVAKATVAPTACKAQSRK